MASNDELAKKIATLTIINQALKSENEEVCAPARLWACRLGAQRPCLCAALTRAAAWPKQRSFVCASKRRATLTWRCVLVGSAHASPPCVLTRGDHLQEEVAELQQEFESRLASAEKTVRQNGRCDLQQRLKRLPRTCRASVDYHTQVGAREPAEASRGRAQGAQ
jgi:hypothetical protein